MRRGVVNLGADGAPGWVLTTTGVPLGGALKMASLTLGGAEGGGLARAGGRLAEGGTLAAGVWRNGCSSKRCHASLLWGRCGSRPCHNRHPSCIFGFAPRFGGNALRSRSVAACSERQISSALRHTPIDNLQPTSAKVLGKWAVHCPQHGPESHRLSAGSPPGEQVTLLSPDHPLLTSYSNALRRAGVQRLPGLPTLGSGARKHARLPPPNAGSLERGRHSFSSPQLCPHNGRRGPFLRGKRTVRQLSQHC